ncbi:MAG: hypothetical protein AB1758_03685 [Candidatus Eremiobacterota bacterium]
MSLIPRGLPLTGPDYRIEVHSEAWGGRDTLIEKQGNSIRIDRPGIQSDYSITVADDSLVLERDAYNQRIEIAQRGDAIEIKRPFMPYDDVTIRREQNKIVVDRQSAFKDVSYERADNEFRIQREAAGKDVVLRRTEAGFEIDRQNGPDVAIKLSGLAAEQGLDMNVWAPRMGLEPQGYALVEKWLAGGLNCHDLLTITEEGDITLWDRSLT